MPRNVSGTYTLPLAPVVPATVIQAAWANTTLDDVAASLTDSLSRSGAGGMTAPFRLIDGSAATPAFAFNAETGTGLFRESAGIMGVSVMGVKVGQFAAGGYKGNLVGPFTVSGDITFNDNVTILGTIVGVDQIGLLPGTAANPSLFFTGDTDTGIYQPAPSELDISVDGVQRVKFDGNGQTILSAPTNPGAPNLSMTVAAGGFAVDLRGRAGGDDLSVVRWLNNPGTIQRATLQWDTANGMLVGTSQATVVQFQTNNTVRLQIATDGSVRVVNSPLMAAPNFWVGETSGAAGSFGIAGGLGASIVTWGTTSAGGGAMDLNASGQRQVQVQHSGGTVVNFHVLAGGVTGTRLQFIAAGTDTNIGYQWAVKNQGDYAFFGNGGVSFQILCTTTGARWIQINGASSTTNPTFGTNGGGVNATVPVYGSGVNVAPGGDSQPHTGAYSGLFADNVRFQDWAQTADNRTSEMRWGGGFTALRVLNDAYNAAVNWIISVGGYGAGVSEVKVNLSNAGTAEVAVLRAVRTAASVFNVGIGTGTPGYQLQVAGTGQVSLTGTVFDLAATSPQGGGTLYLGDTASGAGNGGCIMFGAFPTPVSFGKHFASIKASITDASNNTAGELFFSTKNTSADTGSTVALRITADKRLLDFRDLPVARDVGVTITAAGIPVGGIGVFCCAGTAGWNGVATGSSKTATGTDFIQAAGPGGTPLGPNITTGTWRVLGCISGTIGGTFVNLLMRLS